MTLLTQSSLKQHTLLLAGLGKEAKSSWNYLIQYVLKHNKQDRHNQPIAIWIADEKQSNELDDFWKSLIDSGEVAGFLQLSSSLSQKPTYFTTVIRSPGIPLHVLSDTYGISGEKITSNTQLFFDWVRRSNHPASKNCTIIGVTGTKGKSTTTAMINSVLTDATRSKNTHPIIHAHVLLGGNIGTPALDLVQKIIQERTRSLNQQNKQKAPNSSTYVVLELSCHQLADLQDSPDIAVVQHITPEHLDYYRSVEEYVQAKTAITRYQQEQDITFYFDINDTKNDTNQHTYTTQVALAGKGKKIPFNAQTLDVLEATVGEVLIRAWQKNTEKKHQLTVIGEHNVINAIPSLLLARELGFDVRRAAAAARLFPGLPYRLQFIAQQNAISFYNDSLATTPESAAAAIASFPQNSVILLAGGHDRRISLQPLASSIIENQVKTVILFPPIGEKIKKTIADINAASNSGFAKYTPTYINATSMEQAIDAAFRNACAENFVLLSPGAPSFGVFKDYKDRGDQFEFFVKMKLKQKHSSNKNTNATSK